MTVTNLGDIAVMMRLPAGQRLYGGQAVTVRPVVRGEMQWRPERDADVLLLGDSFCNIYSAGGMGWGEAAGLAEQLSAELGRPLDLIVRNDAGAFATREMLNQELAQGRDRLAGKKLVIWEFAGRELACGDWRVKSTPMTLGQARASRYLQVAPGESLLASGTVQEISAAPRPGTVTYRDHVVQAHLTDLADAAGQPLAATAALVALYSMRDQVWTAAARYRPGQRITLRLRNYDEMDRAAKIGSVKCSLLTGEMEFETPCWGEEPLADAGAAAGAERPAGAGAACWSGGETAGLLTVVAGVLAALACVERRERRERGRKI
jgi:alginate O-acetyltransferase complex protein AlgJ